MAAPFSLGLREQGSFGRVRLKSWIEISAVRLAENFRAVQAIAGSDATVVAVVKADGYGHGAALCAAVLRDAGARWLGVTDAAEGVAVRAALGERDTRILVMCGSEPQDAASIVRAQLTPVVWTLAQVRALEAAAENAGVAVAVHVEVDTGMARQGTAGEDDLRALVEAIQAAPHLRCEGLMTHLCCAEVSGAATTGVAEERFQSAIVTLGNVGSAPEFLHIANTSAVDESAAEHWMERTARTAGARTMVRTGLALYGYCLPLEGASPQLLDRLQPVMTWKARVLSVREVAAGATVGYGATFTSEWPMRLALLPVGYADGFRREASSSLGAGWVVIGGKRAAVVGRVSMNLTVVDVTGIASVDAGTEVVLLGEGVTAEDHAAWAGTIAYDILCGVRGRRILT